MPELLGGLYSFSNRAKRQLRDLLSNPAAYLEQSAEKLRDEAGRPTSARRVAERTFDPSEADIERASAWWNPSPLGVMAGVIKQKGGNWLAGSVEDALRGLKRAQIGSDQRVRAQAAEDALANERMRGAMSPEYLARLESEARRLRGEGNLNDWIEGPLTKYVKTRMASPEDEVRKLAEQGVLHFDPPQRGNTAAVVARQRAGYPMLSQATTEQARNWEDIVDAIPMNASYRDHLPLGAALDHPNTQIEGLRAIGGDFAVQNPEALAYGFNRGKSARDLGFPHLIDELSNALNPASGLPRHLQLTPEAMQNLSMEKAVRRVHDINEWRGEQMAKARLESMAGRPVIREYAENNPKGLRWVQLSREGDFAAESDAMGHSVRGYEPPEKGGSSHYGLGGWDAIQSGRAKVYSLQDAKGEPHVTVEVQSPQQRKQVEAEMRRRAQAEDFDPEDEDLLDVLDAETLEAPRIVQIKGKQNRAPNEEYLPFVQDFVRNSPLGGQWSDVGDLANTGLMRHDFSPELVERMRAAGEDVADYLTEDEIKTLLGKGYAKGGRVTPITIRPGTETSTLGTRGRSWDILSE